MRVGPESNDCYPHTRSAEMRAGRGKWRRRRGARTAGSTRRLAGAGEAGRALPRSLGRGLLAPRLGECAPFLLTRPEVTCHGSRDVHTCVKGCRRLLCPVPTRTWTPWARWMRGREPSPGRPWAPCSSLLHAQHRVGAAPETPVAPASWEGLAFAALQLPPAFPEAAAQAPSPAAGRRGPDAEQAGPQLLRPFPPERGRQPSLPLPSGLCPGHLLRSPTPTSRTEQVVPSPRAGPATHVQVCGLGGVPVGAGMPRAHAGRANACARGGVRVCWRRGRMRVRGSHMCTLLMGPGARTLQFVRLASSPDVNLGPRAFMRVWACSRACVGTSLCVHV